MDSSASISREPRGRKAALAVQHITASVGWAGALGVFLAHAAAGLISQDAKVVSAADMAMGIEAWFVILPLAAASLVSGIVQALTTPWGLFRHYWVLTKLLPAVFATGILLLKLGPIKYVAEAGMDIARSGVDLNALRMSLALHAVGGLVLLLTAIALAVYKPEGMTRFGLTKLRDKGLAYAQRGGPASTLWRKLYWIGAMILIAVVVTMIVGGEHGPSAHLPAAK